MRLRASHAQPRTQHGGDGADKHWVRVGAASVAGTRSSMLGSIEFSGKGSWGVGGDVCSSPSGVVQNNASKVRNAISRPSSLRVGICNTSLSPVTVLLTPFAVIVCADRARENLDGLGE